MAATLTTDFAGFLGRDALTAKYLNILYITEQLQYCVHQIYAIICLQASTYHGYVGFHKALQDVSKKALHVTAELHSFNIYQRIATNPFEHYLSK